MTVRVTGPPTEASPCAVAQAVRSVLARTLVWTTVAPVNRPELTMPVRTRTVVPLGLALTARVP